EARIGRLESLDRGHVHLLRAVEQADEAERGLGEVQTAAQGSIQHLRQLVQAGDLDGDRIERLQLLAKGRCTRLFHLRKSYARYPMSLKQELDGALCDRCPSAQPA